MMVAVYDVPTRALVLLWASCLLDPTVSLMSCGWLFLIMRGLCLVMMDVTLLMQL